MKSKSFNFMCLNVGVLALTYSVINLINLYSALNVKYEVLEEKEIKGFRGD